MPSPPKETADAVKERENVDNIGEDPHENFKLPVVPLPAPVTSRRSVLVATAEVHAGNSSAAGSAPPIVGRQQDNLEYFRQVAHLNKEFIAWVTVHYKKNASCILSPTFVDYNRYIEELERNRYVSLQTLSTRFEPFLPSPKRIRTNMAAYESVSYGYGSGSPPSVRLSFSAMPSPSPWRSRFPASVFVPSPPMSTFSYEVPTRFEKLEAYLQVGYIYHLVGTGGIRFRVNKYSKCNHLLFTNSNQNQNLLLDFHLSKSMVTRVGATGVFVEGACSSGRQPKATYYFRLENQAETKVLLKSIDSFKS